MNHQNRVELYLEAKGSFEAQLDFYRRRIQRARHIFRAVHEKQDASKLTILHLMEVLDTNNLMDDDVIIENIVYEHKGSKKPTVQFHKPEKPSLENNWKSSVLVSIEPILIYGSDRDIAKYARKEFLNKYASVLRERSLKLNSAVQEHEADIELLQQKISSLRFSEEHNERQYDKMLRFREKKNLWKTES